MNYHLFISICEGCKKEFDPVELDADLEYCIDCQFARLTLDKPGTTVLSIDIGIKHLAMVLTRVDNDYRFSDLLWTELFDITAYHCLPNCQLYHTNTLCDRIAHILHKTAYVFERADVVLLEQQPPQGLVAVEQMLFAAHREKSVLVSPMAVQAHFGMRTLDYDQRKEYSVRLASRYLSPSFRHRVGGYVRQHDISDAILITLYWCERERKEAERQRLESRRRAAMQKINKGLGMSLNDYFDRFRYIPTKSSC